MTICVRFILSMAIQLEAELCFLVEAIRKNARLSLISCDERDTDGEAVNSRRKTLIQRISFDVKRSLRRIRETCCRRGSRVGGARRRHGCVRRERAWPAAAPPPSSSLFRSALRPFLSFIPLFPPSATRLAPPPPLNETPGD